MVGICCHAFVYALIFLDDTLRHDADLLRCSCSIHILHGISSLMTRESNASGDTAQRLQNRSLEMVCSALLYHTI